MKKCEHMKIAGTEEGLNQVVIVLDGHSISLEMLEQIADGEARVEISPAASERVREAHRVLQVMAGGDTPIYGLNRGVGLNKDMEIRIDYFERYNSNLIYSHSAGIGPSASERQVRAVMVARLNTLLLGHTGIQPAITELYRDFLNARITPVLPLRGSVGAGDITLLSHIGLAVIGNGEVMYEGKLMDAGEAMRLAGLVPVKLGPKDGLAIVSSNALSAGTGALVLAEAVRLLTLADAVFTLSLEALMGSVSPLDEVLYKIRPYEGAAESAAFARRMLHGSDLEEVNPSGKIQDPLSFRSACHVHGAAHDALGYVRKLLNIQLNSSDDNPCLLPEENRMIPSSNFDTTSWTVGLEMFGIALSHISKISCYRTLKLGTPVFTGLSRFLSPDPAEVIAFGTIQKTITSLDTEIRHLSNPVSADYFSLSGDMEDHANNTPFVVRKTEEMIDRLHYILGIEAMHAAQAIDLRAGTHKLGQGTAALYAEIRRVLPYLSEDRRLTPDIQTMYEWIKDPATYRLILEASAEGSAETMI